MVWQSVQGYPEVVLVGACDVSLFYKTVEWLRQKIGITYGKQEEQHGMHTWHFPFAERMIALRYDPATGISLCPAALAQATDEDVAAFKKLIDSLQFD